MRPAKLTPNAPKNAKKCELVNFKPGAVSTNTSKCLKYIPKRPETIQYNTNVHINYSQSPFSLSVVNFFRVQIMHGKPLPRYLLPFGSGLAVVAVRVDGYSAARQEFSVYFYILRIHLVN